MVAENYVLRTLSKNFFDNTLPEDTWAYDPYGVRLHDPAYDANYWTRGNLTGTWSVSNPVMKYMYYDLGGNLIRTTGGGGPQVDTTLTAGTNYMLPSTVTPNSQTNLS